MKLLILIFLSSIICTPLSAQTSYNGTYKAENNDRMGIVSTLSVYDDSFEIVYSFFPDRYIHDVSSVPKTIAGSGLYNDKNTTSKTIRSGTATRNYRGKWQIDNTAEFDQNGFDFSAIYPIDRDSTTTATMHFTQKDGNKLLFICNDGNVFHGIASTTFYPVPAIFLDNVLSDIYLKQ